MLKKQVEKLTKKILIVTLATSLIFTSCFCHKKMEVKAASVAASLSAYTLYEICLYFGGLAVSALGIGYAYENRDEIAEFGKTVIDAMSSLPVEGWMFGSYAADGNYVYGTEALQEVQDSAWTVIQGGGQSPKNDDDNDGDGDKDADDRTVELNLNGYFLTQAGVNLFNDHIKPIYDKWVNKEEDNILDDIYGAVDNVGWQGFNINSSGYYYGYFNFSTGSSPIKRYLEFTSPIIAYQYYSDDKCYFGCVSNGTKSWASDGTITTFSNAEKFLNGIYYIETDLPILGSAEAVAHFESTGELTNVINLSKSYVVADWIAEDEAWKGHLEDIATSLRSLQDLFTISQQAASEAFITQPSADAYGDMLDNLATEYAPMTNPISDPVYYPVTNPTPVLDPSVFPNYVPSTTPDVGGDGTDTPDDGSTDDPEIDLDGLLSLFNILFYLIMIIIMLIYLFLACLAFIVMIFKIPASSSMLPDDMVLGLEHLKSIMIPGMNISIYGFAMALIYMFIIFAIIRAIRLEINDFKFPRSFK